MKLGFVIPVYNHGSTLESVVKSLLPYNLPIIVVDDGNDETNKNYINDVANKYPLVDLVVCIKNGGKGKAMKAGVRRADEIGLTHIFQIDSDGQHDVNRVGYFIEKSQEHLESIICGYPEYNETAPKNRVNGRKVANMWIHYVTLSCDIKDAMIGFRIYPVKPFIKIINGLSIIDNRMGFDIDILVHMYWIGVPVISEEVRVNYPVDGISNYRNIRDTIRVSLTFTRLCIGLIFRLPILLFRKINKRK